MTVQYLSNHLDTTFRRRHLIVLMLFPYKKSTCCLSFNLLTIEKTTSCTTQTSILSRCCLLINFHKKISKINVLDTIWWVEQILILMDNKNRTKHTSWLQHISIDNVLGVLSSWINSLVHPCEHTSRLTRNTPGQIGYYLCHSMEDGRAWPPIHAYKLLANQWTLCID